MPHIRQTYDCLRQIENALDELRGLAILERQDIVALDLAGLSKRQGEIEKLLKRVSDLHTLVIAQIGSACDASALTGEKTLSRLITVVPKPDRDMYAQLQRSVRSGSADVENELRVNQALLKDSLAFTNYSLQTFTGILKATNAATYGQQGRFVETIDQPRIICKEI